MNSMPDHLRSYSITSTPCNHPVPALFHGLPQNATNNLQHAISPHLISQKAIFFSNLKATISGMSAAPVFTHPSQPAANHGADNQRGELIVSFNDIIGDGHGRDFRVVKFLGAGQFGQVFQVIEMNSEHPAWALKVAKSPPRYRIQAEYEVRILRLLHDHADESELELIPTLVAHFEFKNHLCMAMDLCSVDLYTVLKTRNFVGFPLPQVQVIARQLLNTLVLLERAQVVHNDIKPENIVITMTDHRMKLIDYGSARTLDQECTYYIQSRYYRAPEVVLGIPHGTAIDMWSLGCVLFEVFAGCPLFAGQSEVQLLDIIVGMIGQFPEKVAKRSPRFSELFTPDGIMKSEEQICREQGKLPAKRYKYLEHDNLPDLIMMYQRGISMSVPQALREKRIAQRRLFLDFLLRMLAHAQEDRIKPREALEHPFMVEEMV